MTDKPIADKDIDTHIFYEQWVDDTGKEGINKPIALNYQWGGPGYWNRPVCVLEFDLGKQSHCFKFHVRPVLPYDTYHHIKVYHFENKPSRLELVLNEKSIDLLLFELTRIKEQLAKR